MSPLSLYIHIYIYIRPPPRQVGSSSDEDEHDGSGSGEDKDEGEDEYKEDGEAPMHTYIYLVLCLCVYVYIYIYMLCLCVYACTYIRIYTYICTHTHPILPSGLELHRLRRISCEHILVITLVGHVSTKTSFLNASKLLDLHVAQAARDLRHLLGADLRRHALRHLLINDDLLHEAFEPQ